MKSTQRPLFSFGVITDVQYADIPDGHSFWGIPRYYRHSLEALHEAVSSWNNQPEISFIVQFGDIVDGRCPREESCSAVRKVLGEFEAFQAGPVYHMIGNHCLYNLPREKLCSLLGIAERCYYAFSPHPGFRFVVLDCYDISTLGWPEDHPHSKAAARIMKEKNPNADQNSPAGLPLSDQRFVSFNGGIGQEQLKWLDGNLREAVDCEEKVIVCCHIPLYDGVTVRDTLVWNAEEVLEVIRQYRCVVACLAGHKHEGGYGVDGHGIHHLVLEAVLECPPGDNAFGRVDVYEDKLCLVGAGRMRSVEMRRI